MYAIVDVCVCVVCQGLFTDLVVINWIRSAHRCVISWTTHFHSPMHTLNISLTHINEWGKKSCDVWSKYLCVWVISKLSISCVCVIKQRKNQKSLIISNYVLSLSLFFCSAFSHRFAVLIGFFLFLLIPNYIIT